MGIPKEQAEAQIQMITDLMEENLASKQDIQRLEFDITGFKQEMVQVKQDITEIKQDIIGIKYDMVEIRQDIIRLEFKVKEEISGVRNDLVALENRLIIKMGATMAVLFTLAISILSLNMRH